MYYRYDIQNLLKSKLPSYVVECFKIVGFDNLSALKQMSVTGRTNSITNIEQYIDKIKQHLPQCMGLNMIIAPSLPFKFPPGHVLAIKTAVMEIQSKYGGSGLHHSKAKRRKVDNTASSKNIVEMAGARVNISNIKEDICKRIHKWAKDHNNGEFNSIQENKDYSIIVNISPSDPTKLDSVQIRCGCSRKTTGNQPWQIGNCTRHLTSCRKKRSNFFNLMKQISSHCHQLLTT